MYAYLHIDSKSQRVHGFKQDPISNRPYFYIEQREINRFSGFIFSHCVLSNTFSLLISHFQSNGRLHYTIAKNRKSYNTKYRKGILILM